MFEFSLSRRLLIFFCRLVWFRCSAATSSFSFVESSSLVPHFDCKRALFPDSFPSSVRIESVESDERLRDGIRRVKGSGNLPTLDYRTLLQTFLEGK